MIRYTCIIEAQSNYKMFYKLMYLTCTDHNTTPVTLIGSMQSICMRIGDHEPQDPQLIGLVCYMPMHLSPL